MVLKYVLLSLLGLSILLVSLVFQIHKLLVVVILLFILEEWLAHKPLQVLLELFSLLPGFVKLLLKVVCIFGEGVLLAVLFLNVDFPLLKLLILLQQRIVEFLFLAEDFVADLFLGLKGKQFLVGLMQFEVRI